MYIRDMTNSRKDHSAIRRQMVDETINVYFDSYGQVLSDDRIDFAQLLCTVEMLMNVYPNNRRWQAAIQEWRVLIYTASDKFRIDNGFDKAGKMTDYTSTTGAAYLSLFHWAAYQGAIKAGYAC